MRPRNSRVSPRILACVAVAGLLLPLVGSADPATEARYPFDPACPWGRLANGRGMITRCLSEAEAKGIAVPRPAPVAKPPATGTGPASTPAAPATASPAPSVAQTAPVMAPPASTAPDAGAPAAPTKAVHIELGPIVAEEGELSMGGLSKPLDKYRECVEQNGGLSGKSGEVQVHFLVRGERSRAEGVEVTKVRGVTDAAARCIADTVDRRKTGTPSVPMVGATLVFKISS